MTLRRGSASGQMHSQGMTLTGLKDLEPQPPVGQDHGLTILWEQQEVFRFVCIQNVA